MNVGAEPGVVREIPAHVIGIVVKHDVVTIPEPIGAGVNLERRDAESVTTKPEAIGTSST